MVSMRGFRIRITDHDHENKLKLTVHRRIQIYRTITLLLRRIQYWGCAENVNGMRD